MTEQHEKITTINEQLFGPATSFADLPRDEKQMAYELWAAAQPVETKAERRLRRGRLKTKWALRHSQIKGAAKRRGKPVRYVSGFLEGWRRIAFTLANRLGPAFPGHPKYKAAA